MGVLLVLIVSCDGSWCQQAAAPAQSTPASPQATIAGPDLAVTMKGIEEKLRSVGHLTFTVTLGGAGQPVSSYQDSIEPLSITADPKACSLRMAYRISTGPANYAVYLEEISAVDVLTLEDSYKITYGSQFQPTVKPSLYSARVDSFKPFDLVFQSKEAAEQFAALLRESVKQCSAVPVTLRAPATGSPSLTETVSFIADKLTAQGAVSTLGKLAKDDGSSMPIGSDFNVSNVSSPTPCVIELNGIGMGTAEPRLAFRRIGKIEVIKLKDYFARSWLIGKGYRIVEVPSVFVLEITSPDGQSKELYFSDETVANRVAKAINHAAELCGAGANKEPF
jgi:hypothetical protein